MADQYIQQLSATASVLASYLVPISDDPSGTSRLKKATFTQIVNFLADNAFSSIGIGITPAAKLHVIGTTEQIRVGYDSSNYYSTTVSSAGAVTFDAVGSSAGFTFSDTVYVSGTNPHLDVNASGSYGYIVLTNSGGSTKNGTWVQNASGEMYWYSTVHVWTDYSGATEKMRLNTSGNLGVGTSSPSARIHAISTTQQLRVGYDASNYYSTTVSSTGAVTFDAVGSGAVFSFSDKVGIGKTTPDYNLHVARPDTTATVIAAFENGATEGLEFGHTGSGGVYGVTNTNYIASTYFTSGSFRPLALVTSNSVRLMIDTSGNVGVGVIPLAKFDVAETIRISRVTSGNNCDLDYYNNNTTAGVVARVRMDGDGISNLYGALSFHTTRTPDSLVERMRITSDGLVGIGTTSPSAAMHIIKTSEQFRVGYDTSNYYSTTVSSAGAVTFNAVGASSSFIFSDSISCSSSILSSSSSGGVGYKTGAGGAVTQTTSKSTSVTLNTMCGQITTHTETMAYDALRIFTVYNSTVSAYDTIVISLAGGQTYTGSKVWVATVAAGEFSLVLHNAGSGGSGTDSGAWKINFAVIKAVNS